MLENKKPYLTSQKAILTDCYPVPNAFAQLIRTKIENRDSNIYVTSNGLNMSSSITSLVGADALVVLPPTETGYEKGEIVDILLLSDEGQEIFFVI
jgi:Molybdopterin biosynthesis enzyme